MAGAAFVTSDDSVETSEPADDQSCGRRDARRRYRARKVVALSAARVIRLRAISAMRK
jgi:hypothetical protein